MKTNILYLIGLILLFGTGCSSDSPLLETPEPNTSLHKVTFSIGGLTSNTEEMTRSSIPDSLNIQYLEYWVYKTIDLEGSPGELFKKEIVSHAILRKEDFNQNIELELPSDNYTLLVYAADTIVNIEEGVERTPYAQALGTKSQMFSARKAFILNDQESDINDVIFFKRLVGKVEIVIKDLDKLPDNVKSITPIITGISKITVVESPLVSPEKINLVNNNVFLRYKNILPAIPRSQFPLINEDNPIVFYILPTGCNSEILAGLADMKNLYIQGTTDENYYPLELGFPVSDQNENILFMKKLGQLEVKSNQVTRYIGEIGGKFHADFDIVVDEGWDDITLEVE